MIIHDFEQGTKEWFDVRIGKITGSLIYILKGNSVTRDTRIEKKAAERVTHVKEYLDFKSGELERGHILEPDARMVYTLKTGNDVEEVGFIEKDEFVGCSPDGLVGEVGMIEIKARNDNRFIVIVAKNKKPKPEDIIQMQFNMYVSGRKWCDYIIYNPHYRDNCLIVTRVERDEKIIEELKTHIDRANTEIEEIITNYNRRIDGSNRDCEPNNSKN